MMIDRRLFSLSMLGCFTPALTLAQAARAPGAAADFKPWREVSVSADGRRVLVFFDFACPFCAQYHGPLMDWAGTVPQHVQTLFLPVANPGDAARRDELFFAAAFYYAALTIASRAQLSAFVRAVYLDYGRVRSLAGWDIWMRAADSAGISRAALRRAVQSQPILMQVEMAANKLVDYQLVATPSVAVGGRFVLTPSDSGGSQEMFFNLLNGLTSQIL